MKEVIKAKAIAKALEGSVDKWQKIVDYLRYKREVDWAKVALLEQGGLNCPLCRLKSVARVHRCRDFCPIAENTGTPGCHETPYYEFTTAERERNLKGARKCAKKELRFLKSLR